MENHLCNCEEFQYALAARTMESFLPSAMDFISFSTRKAMVNEIEMHKVQKFEE